ncbi:hypothetical protein QO034_13295 [Sedimentitalea sp. JM2-8]|uniref:Uncharacterized protein n=1 Tax=Sedimentitalea xiamensis TaxID=3050037 RepID=A0ABT7FG38_9RHOB|nr:hypothetical protein [Sedimentitalea xiamensis]MDK3074091.1 hypothetical protein [Sedimentitalea xiamensis]
MPPVNILDHLKPNGKINGKSVIYVHRIKFYESHGYVPSRIGTMHDGTLYDMDHPRRMPTIAGNTGVLNHVKPCGKINGKPVVYVHHMEFFLEHGYCPDRVGTTDDGILFDMVFGPPITSAAAVPKCKLYEILTRFPDVTEIEVRNVRRPIPETVRNEVIGFFRSSSDFVPIGDTVVDKATGGIKLRRFIIERLVADGDLWYDGACYRST